MGAEVRESPAQAEASSSLDLGFFFSPTHLTPFALPAALRACLWPAFAFLKQEPSHILSAPSITIQDKCKIIGASMFLLSC